MTINEMFSYHTDSRKYSEAKSWLQNNHLLTKEVRKLNEGLVEFLTPAISCGEVMLSTGKEGDEAWFVPRPHHSESLRGFKSRLRAWINLFVAYNTRHDDEGWHTPTYFEIVIPDDEE